MRAFLSALVLVFAAFPALAAPASPAAGAGTFLGLVDAGRYADSWNATGTLFRAQVSQARWAQMVAGVRGPLGPVISRRPVGEKRSPSLPGAPDGRYATLKFRTAFARKRAAIETVVMAAEPSGWRVDGYFIR